MTQTMRTLGILVAGGALALAGTAQRAMAQEYAIIDLGTLAGADATTGPGSQAYDLNDQRHACGVSIDATALHDLHAFSWDGSLVDLGVFGVDAHAMALAINNADVSVGMSFTFGQPYPHAVRWTGSTATGLGSWTARDVNDSGVIVGEMPVHSSGAYAHAVRWISGVTTDLGTLGGLHSSAAAIANDGRIVGTSSLANNTTRRAFLWQSGALSDLGTLGGTSSLACDISASGYVVGTAQRSDGAWHAFRYTLGGGGAVLRREDLGELGSGRSDAYAVNELGDVVGTSNWKAFLYRNGAMVDLNTLVPANTGWELTHATAINENGEIAGRGRYHGNERAFVLVPALPGDLDANGVVNEDDRALFCNAMGSTNGQPGFVSAADLNSDQVINEADLALFNMILPPCLGDIVTSATLQPPADGIVDGADLAYLLGAWGMTPSCADFVSSGSFMPPPDGVIDGADLAMLLGAWGSCN